MWRQSHGWIKRGKEFQREIERERGRGEEGRRHMDLITSRWCHVCMSGNQPVGRQRWVYGAKPGLVCDGCREAVCLMCGRKAQSRAQRWVCGFVSDCVWFCCMQTADRILSSHISLRGEKPANVHQTFTPKTSLRYLFFPSGLDSNGLSDPCQMSGTSWCKHKNILMHLSFCLLGNCLTSIKAIP